MKSKETIMVLKKLISDETGIPIDEIKDSDAFFNLGLDSVTCIFLMDKLEKRFHIELNPMHFWDHPTVGEYGTFISSEYQTNNGN